MSIDGFLGHSASKMEIQPTTVIAAFVTDLTGSTLWVDSLSRC